MWKSLASLAVVAVLCTSAFGQAVRDPAKQPLREAVPGREGPIREGIREGVREAVREGAAALTGQTYTADQQIAAVMLSCCRNEVELAKLAVQKAQSPEVKAFAQEMIRDHTAACERLEKFAGNLATPYREGPGEGRAADRLRTDDLPAARPAADPTVPRAAADPARPAPGAEVEVRVQPGKPGADLTVRDGSQRGPLNWVSIHQQIANQCLASAKKEFGQKEGAEFDKCFVGMAIGGHQHALDSQTVLKSYASPQFQAEIERSQETATAHLQEAKTVMRQLEGNPAARAARVPE